MQTTDPGFAVHAGVLQPADYSAILGLLVSEQRSRAGLRHLMSHESVQRVATDTRMLKLAAEFIGPQAMPFKATLFDKSPESNWLVAWHQDIALPVRERIGAADWGPWSTKAGQLYAHAPAQVLQGVVALRLHLDDSTHDNGPLRVLPGTHTQGRLPEERIRALARELKPVECTVAAGGVVVMRPLVVHASSKSNSATSRRVLHIEYATAVQLGSNIQLAVS